MRRELASFMHNDAEKAQDCMSHFISLCVCFSILYFSLSMFGFYSRSTAGLFSFLVELFCAAEQLGTFLLLSYIYMLGRQANGRMDMHSETRGPGGGRAGSLTLLLGMCILMIRDGHATLLGPWMMRLTMLMASDPLREQQWKKKPWL